MQTTGENILEILAQFFTNYQTETNKYTYVRTDSAKLMTGKTADVVAHKKTAPKMCKIIHCILHRHAFAVKRIPDSLRCVIQCNIYC